MELISRIFLLRMKLSQEATSSTRQFETPSIALRMKQERLWCFPRQQDHTSDLISVMSSRSLNEAREIKSGELISTLLASSPGSSALLQLTRFQFKVSRIGFYPSGSWQNSQRVDFLRVYMICTPSVSSMYTIQPMKIMHWMMNLLEFSSMRLIQPSKLPPATSSAITNPKPPHKNRLSNKIRRYLYSLLRRSWWVRERRMPVMRKLVQKQELMKIRMNMLLQLTARILTGPNLMTLILSSRNMTEVETMYSIWMP